MTVKRVFSPVHAPTMYWTCMLIAENNISFTQIEDERERGWNEGVE